MIYQCYFLSVFVFIPFHTAEAQDNESCFVSGECRDSFYLASRETSDEFECLEFCKTEPECAWATFFSSTSYCQLLKTCTSLDAEICTDCLTAQRDCIPDEPSCWIKGECEGIIDFTFPAESATKCLQLCNSTFGCRWFTFYGAAPECIILKTCPTIDETCDECISGERRCIESSYTTMEPSSTFSTTTELTPSTTEMPKAMTKLLVAGGSSKSVEVINLDENIPNLVCDNLEDLPYKLAGLTGQLFKSVQPILCAGYNTGYVSCECYTYVNSSWNQIESLLECVRFPSSITFTMPNNEEFFLITGGLNDESIPNVQSNNGSSWNEGIFADLPYSNWEHCLVKINNSVLFMIGGWGYPSPITANTFFFHIEENRWSPGPTLNIPKRAHSCGIIDWLNPSNNQLEKVVVAIGGENRGIESNFLSSVELLHLNNEQELDKLSWIMGPSLPKSAGFATVVEYQNSVILIGGKGEVDGRHLYQLSSPNGTWTEMKQTLKENRWYHASFLVPDEFVNCY